MAPDARGEAGSRHPDDELLDAYADGERTPGSVDRHVRACTDCQRAVVALRTVRDELARLAPVAMPPDVARRIHAALAAAPPPPAPSDRSGADARRDRRGPGRSRRPPSYGAAARPLIGTPGRPGTLPRARPERLALLTVCLLVVVAGAGLFAVWGPGGSAADRLETSSAAMSGAESAAGGAGQDAAHAPAVMANSAAVAVADSRTALSSDAVVAHAQDLLAGRIPAAGHTTLGALASTQGATTDDQGSTSSSAAGWEAIITPGLLSCYEKLATSVGAVLAIDRVSYQGRDSVLVVLDIQDLSDISGASGAPDGSAGQSGAVPTAAGTVAAGRDHVQLDVVDLGCEADHLADDTRYTETATKA